MKERDPHAVLVALVQKLGTQAAAADQLGVSRQFITDLLLRRRVFSDDMLSKLGLRRVVVAGKVA